MMVNADTKLVRKFRKNLRQFERELFFQNISSCCHGVTLPQCHALLEIENNEEITVTELSGKLNLEKSTVSRTIDSLVNKGLINRKIPPDNRRMTKLSLTQEGAKICDDINWNNDEFISKTLSCLGKDEQLDFIHFFEKITAQLIHLRAEAEKCSMVNSA